MDPWREFGDGDENLGDIRDIDLSVELEGASGLVRPCILELTPDRPADLDKRRPIDASATRDPPSQYLSTLYCLKSFHCALWPSSIHEALKTSTT